MDIPLNAEVQCADGACGHSTVLIVNPVNQTVTHFVLHTKGLLHEDYLVPVELIAESSPKAIHLSCRKAELVDLSPFTQNAFVGSGDTGMEFNEYQGMAGASMMWPYTTPSEAAYIPMEEVEQIPHGELAIHKGADVEATDGRVGRVDEFVVNPENSHITHLVLRQGHLWGKRDVTVPLNQIDRIDKDVVYLKLDKAAVGQLPAVPLSRR